MVHTIKSLRQLPFKTYSAYVLKTEEDKKIAGNKTAYLFVSKYLSCIILFVEGVKEIDGK